MFWQHAAERLPQGRAARSDAEVDVRSALDHLLTGMCLFLWLLSWAWVVVGMGSLPERQPLPMCRPVRLTTVVS